MSISSVLGPPNDIFWALEASKVSYKFIKSWFTGPNFAAKGAHIQNSTKEYGDLRALYIIHTASLLVKSGWLLIGQASSVANIEFFFFFCIGLFGQLNRLLVWCWRMSVWEWRFCQICSEQQPSCTKLITRWNLRTLFDYFLPLIGWPAKQQTKLHCGVRAGPADKASTWWSEGQPLLSLSVTQTAIGAR